VFVSSAAGGVGSVACQIAKIKGCHVVGSCGSDDKVRWLFDELKVDHAFNYRKLGETNNISSELRRVCPNGIDLLDKNKKNTDNSTTSSSSSSGPSNLSLAVSHRLKLQGFIWSDHNDVINEFNSSMSKWINEGRIKWKENIFEGLESHQKLSLAYLKEIVCIFPLDKYFNVWVIKTKYSHLSFIEFFCLVRFTYPAGLIRQWFCKFICI